MNFNIQCYRKRGQSVAEVMDRLAFEHFGVPFYRENSRQRENRLYLQRVARVRREFMWTELPC